MLRKKNIVFILLTINIQFLGAQDIGTRFRTDSLGTIMRTKTMTIDGNRIATAISSNGKIGMDNNGPFPSFVWPKGTGGFHFMPISLFVGVETTTNKGVTIHSIETNYKQDLLMDKPSDFGLIPSAVAIEPLGFNAVPDYSNFSSKSFARSDDPLSWPLKWPKALGLDSTMNGHWYGYFGKDIFNASLETYSVFDDSKDYEFTYPYPASRGYYYPINADQPVNAYDADGLLHYYDKSLRKGLGLRVEARTFQWSQEKLENALFVMNYIYNISDINYTKSCLGLFINPHIGNDNDSGDDLVIWNNKFKYLDFFDSDDKAPGIPDKLGRAAIVFLETPSNYINGIDDDGDGIIDERQNDGIDNDGDWQIFTDLNSNGLWDWDPTTQIGEPLNNDVGADGIGPDEEAINPLTGLKYIHIPDIGEGDGIPTTGEPNFDIIDFDEKDMIGITSAKSFVVSSLIPKNDDGVWDFANSNKIDLTVQKQNINLIVGSSGFSLNNNYGYGNFPVKFSYAVIFGVDSLELQKNVENAIEWYNSGFQSKLFGVGVNNSKNYQPNKFILYYNYPNPFNPKTVINYQIPSNVLVELKVFDLLGREVAVLVNEQKPAGYYSVSFDGSNLSSGIYFYRLKAGNFTETKRMMLVK